MKKNIYLLIIVILFPLFGFTQTITWNGSVDSNWNTKNNWDGNKTPKPSNDAVITSSPNDPVLNNVKTVKSLVVENGATLTINSGKTLNVIVDLMNTGTLNIDGGNLTVGGNMSNGSNSDVGYADGDYDNTPFASLVMSDGTTISVGRFVNYHNSTVESNNVTFDVGLSLFNDGVYDMNGGTITIGEIFGGGYSGVFNLISGEITVTGYDGVNYGGIPLCFWIGTHVDVDSPTTLNIAKEGSLMFLDSGGVVANQATINLSGKMDVAGTLMNMDKSNLASKTDAKFVVKSGAEGTGSLITNGAVTNTGTFNIERYVNYTGIGTMSSPVSGATTSVFAGKVSGAWGIEVMGHTEDTRRVVNGNSNSFDPITVASNTLLNVMEGYAFEMNASAQTITFTGTPNTGDHSFELTSTQHNGSYYGWNLVGNPYPSAITWTNMTNVIDTTIIGSTMYVYNGADNDADADSWLSFNPNDPLPPNGELDHIPLGGAFFVKLRDAEPNLIITLTNDFRVHNNDNVNFGSVDIAKKSAKKSSVENLPDNFFQLVSKANGKTDKANYHWLEEATSDLDLQFDSHKMIAWGPDNPNVFFWAGEEMASLQQEPETETIQVGYSSYTSGEVEFSIENVTTFAEVILEDKQKPNEEPIDLLKSSYVFTATGEDENRFVIYLKKNTLSEVEKNLEDTKIYANEDKICFSFAENISEGTVLVYDMQGRIVRNFAIANNRIFELETNLTDGVYVVKINADGNLLSKTILLQQ